MNKNKSFPFHVFTDCFIGRNAVKFLETVNVLELRSKKMTVYVNHIVIHS